MKSLLITISLLSFSFLHFTSFAQISDWNWSTHVATLQSSKRVIPTQVRTDSEGNTYTFLHTRDNFQVDGQTYEIFPPFSNSHCTTIIKTNAQGEVLWVKAADYVKMILGFNIDQNDNIHVLNLDNYLFPGYKYHYSVYDKDWNLLSTRQFAHTASGASIGIGLPQVEFDAQGNYYLGFRTFGGGQWILEGDTLDLNYFTTYMIAKYNSADELQWLRQATSLELSRNSFDVSQNGDVYLIGIFKQEVTIHDQTIQSDNNGAHDAFCAKFDTNGNLAWAHSWGNEFSDDIVNDIVVRNDLVYLTGSLAFGDFNIFGEDFSVDFYDPYVLILDTDGNFNNLFTFPINLYASDGKAIEVTDDGNIILAGNYSGFDPIMGTHTLPEANDTETFVAFLNPAGEVLSVETAGGYLVEDVSDIAILDENHIAAAGFFHCDITIGDNTWETVECVGGNSYDAFISVLEIDFPSNTSNAISPEVISKIYPNPNVGMFNVEVSKDMDITNLQYEVLNAQSVSLQKGRATAHSFSIDLSDFHSGIYLIKVFNKKQVAYRKVVID